MRVNLVLLMAVVVPALPDQAAGRGDPRHGRRARRGHLLRRDAARDLAPDQRPLGSVARDRDLLRPEVSEQDINAILLAATPNLGFYLGVIVLAIVAPRWPRSATS